MILWMTFFHKKGFSIKEEIFILSQNSISNSDCCDSKINRINLDAMELMIPYFEKVSYEACEYNFTTLYMWEHLYNTRYCNHENFLLVIVDHGDKFAIQPICEKEHYEEALQFIADYFNRNNADFEFRGVTKEFIDYLEEKHPGEYEYIPNRDIFDYVYDAEKLRKLSGRKYHSKKNHYNGFLKAYEGRFEYRRLSKEDYFIAMEVLEKWANNASEEGKADMAEEKVAIEKVMKNLDKMPHVKAGGIFVDGVLEAFTFGELLNPNMALIHIEKANSEIRGLFNAINKIFLENEFPEVEFVNREEDLGIEGLRKAKLSYNPIKMVEKFTVVKK